MQVDGTQGMTPKPATCMHIHTKKLAGYDKMEERKTGTWDIASPTTAFTSSLLAAGD